MVTDPHTTINPPTDLPQVQSHGAAATTRAKTTDSKTEGETPGGTSAADTTAGRRSTAGSLAGSVVGSSGAGSTIATRIQALVLESDAVHDFMDRLAHVVSDHFSTKDRTVLCGITLIRPRLNTTVASSSDRAQAMDEIQYSFGDGPCLDAARHHNLNYVPDVQDVHAADQRWPEYRAAIAEHGLRTILAVPVSLVDDETGCAINIYTDTPHAFTPAEIETAQNLALEASTTVRVAVRVAHLSDTAEDLRTALDSRTTIDLAAGIIMAQNRCSQDKAVTILKAASSARNIKLRDLAGTIIASITAEPTATHFDN